MEEWNGIHSSLMNCFNKVVFLHFYNKLQFHSLSRDGKMLGLSAGIKISISSKIGHNTLVLSTIDTVFGLSEWLIQRKWNEPHCNVKCRLICSNKNAGHTTHCSCCWYWRYVMCFVVDTGFYATWFISVDVILWWREMTRIKYIRSINAAEMNSFTIFTQYKIDTVLIVRCKANMSSR